MSKSVVFSTQNDPKRNRSESALIRNLGGGSIWSPVSRLHDSANAQLKMADSAILREKSENSPRNVAGRYQPLFYNLENKKFLRHKTALWEFSRICYLFFSTNYFSTPLGVCLNKKTPSHFTS